VVIAVVLSGIALVADVRYTGPPGADSVGAGLLGFLNSLRMARLPDPVPAGGSAEMALG
jgi:hypothetical protein